MLEFLFCQENCCLTKSFVFRTLIYFTKVCPYDAFLLKHIGDYLNIFSIGFTAKINKFLCNQKRGGKKFGG